MSGGAGLGKSLLKLSSAFTVARFCSGWSSFSTAYHASQACSIKVSLSEIQHRTKQFAVIFRFPLRAK